MTAEELFIKHANFSQYYKKDLLDKIKFAQALAEYRESIIKMIDERIEEYKEKSQEYEGLGDYEMQDMNDYKEEALTEIRDKIKEMK